MKITGAKLYKLFSKVWYGKAMLWRAVPTLEKKKWEQLAKEISSLYVPNFERMSQLIETLRHNSQGY